MSAGARDSDSEKSVTDALIKKVLLLHLSALPLLDYTTSTRSDMDIPPPSQPPSPPPPPPPLVLLPPLPPPVYLPNGLFFLIVVCL